MIRELIIDNDFKLLGVTYSAGDVISLEYTKEADSINYDDDISIKEQQERLSKLKNIYIENFLTHTRIVTIDKSSGWMDMQIFTMRDYNMSSLKFIDLLNSINSGKILPEDIELGYKFKGRQNLECNMQHLSHENKQKLIKKIIGNYPDYLESLNSEAGKVNFFGHVNKFRTQEDIDNESIEEYNELNNNTYLEYKVDDDNIFIVELSIQKVELDNGFSGFEFDKLIYKTNSDYTELEIYTEFNEILMNLLSMGQPGYRDNNQIIDK
jgi:hypothetical protein